jgi:DNA-binding transcriptional ArsR family regulator
VEGKRTMAETTEMTFDKMQENAEQASTLLKSMSNENRLLILCQLVEGEKSVTELQQRVPLSQSALSQHLAVLRRDGLVTTKRVAQSIFYSLASIEAQQVLSTLYGLYCV